MAFCSKAKGLKKESTVELNCTWNLASELSEQVQLNRRVVENVVQLFDEENTIPFIARYRQHQTNSMEPEKLREVKEKLDELREVQSKIVATVKKVEKIGKLDACLKSSFLSSRSIEEVEHLYAPFKSTNKKTYADRARELGLERYAQRFLSSDDMVNLHEAVNHSKEGLSSISEVETGVQHIMSDIISKDHQTMELVRRMCKNGRIILHSNRKRSKKDNNSAGTNDQKKKKESDSDKYELYYSFSCDINRIQPHQILAINRGESQKVLSVKIEISLNVMESFLEHCKKTFVSKSCNNKRSKLILCSAEDAYKRLIEPLMMRSIRRDLNKIAEKASISVFADNLKRLLLSPPVRGKCVLGVDPGFTHGCKYALISTMGQIETVGVVYLHGRQNGINRETEVLKISEALKKFRCETVAIGNGVGCRETETFFSDHIKRGTFYPLKVVFCIVSEAGASIYSASEEAKKELPHLDVSVRGAVSIARRLQDPLAELVKIDPKNIGVGMYQHDVSEKQLKMSLEFVVEECVSFVGIDINVSSEVLLRHIAGINSGLAKKIVEYRNTRGPFQNRRQLLNVSGVGPKTFEQASGFLRVLPETRDLQNVKSEISIEETSSMMTQGKRKEKCSGGGRASKKMKLENDSETNNLDMTCIHPESYDIADRLISMVHLDKRDIGMNNFMSQLKHLLQESTIAVLAKQFDTSEPTMKQITDGLLQPIGHDFRDDNAKPLFREGIQSLSDLKIRSVVTGKVTNVTHFGAFVDLGVGKDGLIPLRGLGNGKTKVELGNLVQVSVETIDIERGRIGLRLIKVSSG